MLSDSQIRHFLHAGELRISPLDDNDIQPASVDLHLGASFRMFDASIPYQEIDPYGSGPIIPPMLETASATEPLRLYPGQFVLGHTVERISLSPRLLGRYEGKSSIGRLGLATHITAGFVDPGWDGRLTLEIVNHAPHVWILRPGQPIGQIAFEQMVGLVERPYGTAGNHYQGSDGVRGWHEEDPDD